MIVPMTKLTLLCRAADRESTLKALAELGVLHVTPMTAPGGADLDAARAKADTLRRVLDAVPKGGGGENGRGDAAGLAAELASLLEKEKAAKDQLDRWRGELVRLAPFGKVDPEEIAALAQSGVKLKLYRAPLKDTPDLPDGTSAEMLGTGKTDGYWAVFGRGAFEWAGAEEIRLPEKSTDAIQTEIDRLEAECRDAESRLAAAAADRKGLEAELAKAEAAVKFEEVRSGMGDEGVVAVVRGFVPTDALESVRQAAAERGWGLLAEEPGPDDDVPVALKQPKWAKPIQAVFDGINILPAYNEADVSGVFMLFFSLFFAMIIGDAGYGAIFLALTLAFRKKMPADARNLLLVTSGATVLWGLVTGTIFGISHEILKSAHLDVFWINFLTDGVRGAQNLMGMCFLIGAIQITIGHVWNIVDLVRQKSTKALEQLGWTMTTWYMFFLADNMVIGGNMAAYLGSPACLKPFTGSPLDWVCLLGIALIALFMLKPSEIKDGWFNLALLPLNIINNFTDVVSYVRLYAVGAAGFAVAEAFNTMIFGGEVTLVGGIVGAVLVFLAHTLNILLCVMGVLVHGIRLNTLEFSNHKGISWSGSAYRPFAEAKEAM